MGSGVVVLVAALIALVFALAWAIHSRVSVRASLTGGHPTLTAAVRFERRRALASLTLTLALLAASIVAGLHETHLLGLPLILAPAVAGTGGLLLYAATPSLSLPLAPDSTRTARLERRRPWSFLSTRARIGLAALSILAISLFVTTGATSSPDHLGRFRTITFSRAMASSSSGPYPGWYYTVPLLIATALFIGAALLALHRLASTPSLPGPDLAEADLQWRRASTSILTALITAVLCLELGGIAFLAGLTMRSATEGMRAPFASTIAAPGLLTLGAITLVVSLVWFLLAVRRAVDLSRTVGARTSRPLSHA